MVTVCRCIFDLTSNVNFTPNEENPEDGGTTSAYNHHRFFHRTDVVQDTALVSSIVADKENFVLNEEPYGISFHSNIPIYFRCIFDTNQTVLNFTAGNRSDFGSEDNVHGSNIPDISFAPYNFSGAASSIIVR